MRSPRMPTSIVRGLLPEPSTSFPWRISRSSCSIRSICETKDADDESIDEVSTTCVSGWVKLASAVIAIAIRSEIRRREGKRISNMIIRRGLSVTRFCVSFKDFFQAIERLRPKRFHPGRDFGVGKLERNIIVTGALPQKSDLARGRSVLLRVG